jgi:YOP proteins translocation protein K (YscK)
MSAGVDAGRAWDDFMALPVGYITLDRFAACFAGAVSTDVCARLKDSVRLRQRLSSLIETSYGLPDAIGADSVDPQDQAVALASGGQLDRIVLSAGAITWSAVIAATVLARDVAALQAHIGEDVSTFAIRHRDLSGPEQPLEPFETLAARIIGDGWLCYAAWCDEVDPAIGARARLKRPQLPDIAAPNEEFLQDFGALAIRRAANAR